MLERAPADGSTRWSAAGTALAGTIPIVVMSLYIEAETWAAHPTMLPPGAPDMLSFTTIFTAMPVFLLGSLGGVKGIGLRLLSVAAGFASIVGVALAVFVMLFAGESHGATVIGPALGWSGAALAVCAAAGGATGRRIVRSKSPAKQREERVQRAIPYGLGVFLGSCAGLLALAIFTEITRVGWIVPDVVYAIVDASAATAFVACSLVAFGGQQMLGARQFGTNATGFVLLSAVLSVILWAPFGSSLFTTYGCRRTTHFETYYFMLLAISIAYPLTAWLMHRALWRAWEYRGVCPKCRYDMRGLPAPRCPECGWEHQEKPDSV